MVEFIPIGNSVKLTALHLPKSGCIWATGVDVAQAIAFSFSSAVLPSELWSTHETHKVFVNFLNGQYFMLKMLCPFSPHLHFCLSSFSYCTHSSLANFYEYLHYFSFLLKTL